MAGEIELSIDNVRALASLQQFADDQDLRSVQSYEDAMALAEQINETVINISEELGSGFALLNDKDKLMKTPFVVIQWRFTAGDFGGFVSAAVVTKGGDKFIINDGSSGIMSQLMELSQKHKRFGGLNVPMGLRKSQYATCPDFDGGCGRPMSRDEVACSNEKCGYEGDKRGQSETFYFDTSADANK